MKKLLRSQTSVVVGTSSAQLIVPNDKRFSIVISCPRTNRITLSFGAPAVLDQGITLFPGGLPFVLLYNYVGGSIREEVFAIADTVAQTVGILDLFWP